MSRVKRGKIANKRRKNLLKQAKGFMWRRKSHYRAAKEAVLHAGKKAYYDRKKKKGDFKKLWQTQIGAASREHGISYSRFISGLKKTQIELDRKILADIAQNNPEVFAKIIEQIK